MLLWRVLILLWDKWTKCLSEKINPVLKEETLARTFGNLVRKVLEIKYIYV